MKKRTRVFQLGGFQYCEFKFWKKRCRKCGHKLYRTFKRVFVETALTEYIQPHCLDCGWEAGREVCKDYKWPEDL